MPKSACPQIIYGLTTEEKHNDCVFCDTYCERRFPYVRRPILFSIFLNLFFIHREIETIPASRYDRATLDFLESENIIHFQTYQICTECASLELSYPDIPDFCSNCTSKNVICSETQIQFTTDFKAYIYQNITEEQVNMIKKYSDTDELLANLIETNNNIIF